MMKVLVFTLFVVANFSDNGKASVDTILPASVNHLLEDSTKNSDNSCHRPCKFNVKPRRCDYKFRIEPTITEEGRPAIAINNIIPGPAINVCVNDIIVVEVDNRIPDQDVSIHWHGLDQKGTPFMDGVPMVTQCPIGYISKYNYAFRASTPGTFFYHADSVTQQTDGVFGALVVNQPQPLEPHAALYDYDRSEENTLIVSAAFPKLFTGTLEDLSILKPMDLKINGDRDSTKVFVMPGFSYRLRLINAIGVGCPVLCNIDSHEMTVIATDGKPVKPVLAKNVLLYPGERMDVTVRAAQDTGGYWLRMRGHGTCAGVDARAMIIYSGFNYTSMLGEDQEKKVPINPDLSLIVNGQSLESLTKLNDVSNPDTEVKSYYLGIDVKKSLKDVKPDFRYISDAIPKLPFFPLLLATKDNTVVQINHKSFLYPEAPLLLTPSKVRADSVCRVGQEGLSKEPQCVQVLSAKAGEVFELALVNEGFGSNDSYTFHLHGYNMQVLATYQNPNNKPISKDDFRRWEEKGKIYRNFVNAPLKDTVMVPNKGYTIVRISADHPGTWLMECRSCGLSSLPTAIIISVAQTLPKAVIDSLPKCGNYRPPDVLLN